MIEKVKANNKGQDYINSIESFGNNDLEEPLIPKNNK